MLVQLFGRPQVAASPGIKDNVSGRQFALQAVLVDIGIGCHDGAACNKRSRARGDQIYLELTELAWPRGFGALSMAWPVPCVMVLGDGVYRNRECKLTL